MSSPAPGQVIVDLAFGFVLSAALTTAAKFTIADRLEGGPKTAETLAKEVGVHAQSLHRVLRMLASCGVFREDGEFDSLKTQKELRSHSFQFVNPTTGNLPVSRWSM